MSELERWQSRFAAPDYHFGTAPNAFLKSQAHRLKAGQKALALADGEGRNGVWLAQQGLDVLSLDFSPNALKKARALASARGVELRVELADLAQWRWPVAAFDLIAAIFIQFADPPFREKIFTGIKRALKPGGLLLMQGYRPEQLGYRQVDRRRSRISIREACSKRPSAISPPSSSASMTAWSTKAPDMPACR